MARRALRQRVGAVVPIVLADIAFAEIDGERLRQITLQLGLAVGTGVDLAEPIGRGDLEARKHVASRIGDDDAFRLGRDEGGEAIQKLRAGGVCEQRIGERLAILTANPIDERERQPAGPVAWLLEHAVTDDAAALVAPEGKGALVEQRCDHQQAIAVGERSGVVAVVGGVAGDAVKHQQQGRIAASWPVGEDREARAVHVDRLPALSQRDRLRRDRWCGEKTGEESDCGEDAPGVTHLVPASWARLLSLVSQNRHYSGLPVAIIQQRSSAWRSLRSITPPRRAPRSRAGCWKRSASPMTSICSA